jgi:type IV secretory pathway TrbD component
MAVGEVMSKGRFIIALVGFVVFGWVGSWVGVFTWLLILGIWGACSPAQPKPELEQPRVRQARPD